MGERAPAFVRGEVVVGDRRARRPLIRRAMNPERGGEAMEIIGVVGEQVGPSEAPPFPDRIVDKERMTWRELALCWLRLSEYAERFRQEAKSRAA